jgi:hypothetical protein
VTARKALRLKIGWDGALYVDGGRLADGGLEAFLEQVRAEDAAVICYREGTGRPASREQQDVLDQLKAEGLDLVHPADAPAEWGPLQSFELELTPNKVRLSALRGKDMLFAYTPEGGSEPLAYLFKGVGEAALQNLDLLLSANRVVETKPREPDRAFCEETLAVPGLHLRFSYGPKKGWQGWYEGDAVPENLENLYLGCRSLGLHVVTQSVEKPQEPGSA